MQERGRDRVEADILKKIDKGTYSETPGATAALKHLVQPLAEGISAALATENGRRGRPSVAPQLLADISTDLVAYLALKEAVNLGAGGRPVRRLSRHIGSVLEDEVRMAVFDGVAPELYRTVERDVNRKSWDPEHAAIIFSVAAKAADIPLPRWSDMEKIHIGLFLLDMVMEHTGLIQVRDVPTRRNKTVKHASLTDTGRRWVEDFNTRAALLRPALTPTVVPPLPWMGTVGGGYLTHAIRPFCIVKRTFKPHVEALKSADMSHVYRAVNAVQETPWRINTRILAVMEEATRRGVVLPGLPLPDPEPLPDKPPDIGTNDDAKRAWKEAAKQVYEANAEAEGRRLELSQLLTIGQEYRDEDALYFPHQLDFRGRMYAVPNTLHPQGSDRAKALLHFAEGKQVGKDGLRWLAIHGSNLFGNDKVSFEEREAWAWKNAPLADLCAADPFTNRWWTEADSPWCFLAWCFEWSATQWGAADQGEAYVSHIPIALDGSCNGLQHFSAMLRDPVGGAAVNLLPSGKPQDIYQRVADRTKVVLEEHAKGDDEGKRDSAYGWLRSGIQIDRKLCKRPVMVLPYGGTMTSCRDYTRAAVREQIKAGAAHNFGETLPKAEAYLASVIWQAIGDVVVAARKVMDWLQKVARVAAKHGQPLQWTAPSGFVAHQEYRDVRHRQVRSCLRGSIIKISHMEQLDDLHPGRQALAASPNFVHSMDAAAMMLTINRCLDAGLSNFAMIHDSYGTYAADTEAMAGCLREAFVQMYEDHNVLEELRRSVLERLPEEARHLIPPPPSQGSLDLKQVLQSAYFFA